MLLSFVSAILPDFSLFEVIDLARSIGYDCVELMCWPPGEADRRYAGVTHLDVLKEEQIATLRELSSSSGIGVDALGYYPNPLTANLAEADFVVEHLKKVIRAAQALNINCVSTFVGRDWARSVEDNWPRFLNVWPGMVSFAADHGVRVAIENCPMLFTRDEWPGGKNLAHSPAIWRRMFDAIPNENFGLTYDPSHLIWQQMDYTAPLREFSSRIFRVHIKDAYVDKQKLSDVGVLAYPLEFHAPRIPGRGSVNWTALFAGLQEIGYTGPVCIEVEDRDYEHDRQSRVRALRESYQYIRPLLSSKPV